MPKSWRKPFIPQLESISTSSITQERLQSVRLLPQTSSLQRKKTPCLLHRKELQTPRITSEKPPAVDQLQCSTLLLLLFIFFKAKASRGSEACSPFRQHQFRFGHRGFKQDRSDPKTRRALKQAELLPSRFRAETCPNRGRVFSTSAISCLCTPRALSMDLSALWGKFSSLLPAHAFGERVWSQSCTPTCLQDSRWVSNKEVIGPGCLTESVKRAGSVSATQHANHSTGMQNWMFVYISRTVLWNRPRNNNNNNNQGLTFPPCKLGYMWTTQPTADLQPEVKSQ